MGRSGRYCTRTLSGAVMWGWVGELASAFSSAGFPGLVVLALLIVIALLFRVNHHNHKTIVTMHSGLLEALNRSTDSHLGVAKVLSRIEAILGLKDESNGGNS